MLTLISTALWQHYPLESSAALGLSVMAAAYPGWWPWAWDKIREWII